MSKNDTSRLSRLTAILTQLQTKRLVTAPELAKRFNISVRTIYRDIRALEAAGVPIWTEDGKGYTLMDDFRLAPVALSESEANALITAEQFVLKNKDASFVKHYSEAIIKIKSVLKNNTKEKADLLSNRIVIRQNAENIRSSNYLIELQLSLTNYNLVDLNYFTPESSQHTKRIVEPFALYSTQDNWLLIAYCRLRKEFRAFRLDRIVSLTVLEKTFSPHKMSLYEYFEECKKKSMTHDIGLSK